MSKLTKDKALEIYQRVWYGESPDALAKQYSTTRANISAIKHGYSWCKATGHVKGTVPAFIKNMSFDEKIAWIDNKPDSSLVVSDRYWELFEEYDQETADKFKQLINEKRYHVRRKLTIQEVEDEYQKFKNENTDVDNSDHN